MILNLTSAQQPIWMNFRAINWVTTLVAFAALAVATFADAATGRDDGIVRGLKHDGSRARLGPG